MLNVLRYSRWLFGAATGSVMLQLLSRVFLTWYRRAGLFVEYYAED